MNQKKHNVEGWNEANMALNKMDEYIKDCQRVSCNDDRTTDMKTWILNQCSKLLYLEMQAKPKSAAHLYFNSAVASGFREMFMATDNTGIRNFYTPEFYPKDGPCSVKTLKKSYRDDGNMEDKGKTTHVWGMNWFFCFPKKPKNGSKCTIL